MVTLSLYIYFLLVLYFIKNPLVGDLMSFDIILPSPDDGSLEPKRYNIDFLLHYVLLFGLTRMKIL